LTPDRPSRRRHTLDFSTPFPPRIRVDSSRSKSYSGAACPQFRKTHSNGRRPENGGVVVLTDPAHVEVVPRKRRLSGSWSNSPTTCADYTPAAGCNRRWRGDGASDGTPTGTFDALPGRDRAIEAQSNVEWDLSRPGPRPSAPTCRYAHTLLGAPWGRRGDNG